MVYLYPLDNSILTQLQGGDKTLNQLISALGVRRHAIRSHVVYLKKNRLITLSGDFFNGGTFHYIDPTTITTNVYNQSGNLDSSESLIDPVQRVGIVCGPGLDAKISKISVSLKVVGSPVGNVTINVRDSTDAVVATATIAISSLTTSFSRYEVTLNASRTLQSGDTILAEYSGGTDTDHVEVQTSSTSPMPIGFSTVYYSGGVYHNLGNVINASFDSSQSPP